MPNNNTRVPASTNPSTLHRLEQIIDEIGLASTLAALAGICSEKSDHIRASYQDEELARQWYSAGRKLYKISTGRVYGKL